MIQFRRGTTKSWKKTKTKLASGQPGYDKDKHKIKIGDGEKLWSELPYASGLFAEEILNSEEAAKKRKAVDAEDTTLITYGTEAPNKNTTGQLYLQQYEAAPEADYVIEYGTGDWTYQKWNSGILKCWGIFKVSTMLPNNFEGTGLNYDSMAAIKYPVSFKVTPMELATLQNSGNIAWLASKTNNTPTTSGAYTIISPDTPATNLTYTISIQAEGFWK